MKPPSEGFRQGVGVEQTVSLPGQALPLPPVGIQGYEPGLSHARVMGELLNRMGATHHPAAWHESISSIRMCNPGISP